MFHIHTKFRDFSGIICVCMCVSVCWIRIFQIYDYGFNLEVVSILYINVWENEGRYLLSYLIHLHVSVWTIKQEEKYGFCWFWTIVLNKGDVMVEILYSFSGENYEEVFFSNENISVRVRRTVPLNFSSAPLRINRVDRHCKEKKLFLRNSEKEKIFLMRINT